MIIDFHTHAFPDALAPRTIPMLASLCGESPCTDGTADALRAALQRAGVDLGVVLPVVTKPSQFRSINDFAKDLNHSPRLVSFGGIHPDDDDIPAHIAEIRTRGLGGVKIHPDYQNTFIDDEKYICIARACLKEHLILITHAGVDAGYPTPVHCPPDRAAKFLDAVYGGDEPEEPQIVLAHGGGNQQQPDVLRHLVGRAVYFDLAYILHHAKPADITALIRAHSADKILFASDCPWSDPSAGVQFVRDLPLTTEEKSKILGENAQALLRRFHTL